MREKTAHHELRTEQEDSNLRLQVQSLPCCHYTMFRSAHRRGLDPYALTG